VGILSLKRTKLGSYRPCATQPDSRVGHNFFQSCESIVPYFPKVYIILLTWAESFFANLAILTHSRMFELFSHMVVARASAKSDQLEKYHMLLCISWYIVTGLCILPRFQGSNVELLYLRLGRFN
jgi:hypothetical protein